MILSDSLFWGRYIDISYSGLTIIRRFESARPDGGSFPTLFIGIRNAGSRFLQAEEFAWRRRFVVVTTTPCGSQSIGFRLHGRRRRRGVRALLSALVDAAK